MPIEYLGGAEPPSYPGMFERTQKRRMHWWIGDSSLSVDWRSRLPRDVKGAPVWRESVKHGNEWVDYPLSSAGQQKLLKYFALVLLADRISLEDLAEKTPSELAEMRRTLEEKHGCDRHEFEVNTDMADWVSPEYVK